MAKRSPALTATIVAIVGFVLVVATVGEWLHETILWVLWLALVIGAIAWEYVRNTRS